MLTANHLTPPLTCQVRFSRFRHKLDASISSQLALYRDRICGYNVYWTRPMGHKEPPPPATAQENRCRGEALANGKETQGLIEIGKMGRATKEG
jgi:hypothetical protein